MRPLDLRKFYLHSRVCFFQRNYKISVGIYKFCPSPTQQLHLLSTLFTLHFTTRKSEFYFCRHIVVFSPHFAHQTFLNFHKKKSCSDSRLWFLSTKIKKNVNYRALTGVRHISCRIWCVLAGKFISIWMKNRVRLKVNARAISTRPVDSSIDFN